VPRIGLPHQDREVQPGRPATDADDLHARSSATICMVIYKTSMF
jgi:hypothetical protein